MSAKLRLCVVGKLKDGGLQALCDDYGRRIQRVLSFEQVECRDDAALRRAAGQGGVNIALEVLGRQYSSRELAAALEQWLQRGSSVTFLIGGASGLPTALSEEADARLSLSSLTLPHRLARVILCEQLYRATTIWRNEPYARED